MPPLEAVDRAQIALAPVAQPALLEELRIPRPVPNPIPSQIFTPLRGELLRVRAAADEPDEVLDDAAEEGAFCGEEGEGRVREGEAEVGRCEDGESASAGAVWTDVSCV